MQKHIFRNMDGMTYSDFLDVFVGLKHKENLLVRDFCLDSYRFVIGEWVYHRLRDTLLKHYGLDKAEQIIESGKIIGVTFVISEDIDPNTVQLEKKPPQVYISTCGRGPGKTLFDKLMKADINSMYPYQLNGQDAIKALQNLKKGVYEFYSSNKEDNMNYRIKDVIFSGPCTIVLWKDGTKTIVRCENEFFDREKGLAMAICKKVLGTNNSGSNYYDIFKKYCFEEGVIYNFLDDVLEFFNKKFNVLKEYDFDRYMNLPEEPVVFTIEQVANKTGLSKTTINRRCLYKDYPNAKKIDGIWWIPEVDFQKDIKEGK